MPISPLSKETFDSIQAKIDHKTKPLGALGALEPLALQLALINQQRRENNCKLASASLSNTVDEASDKISMKKPSMLVFAGDHGINEEKLSIAPSEVTQQMVVNFLLHIRLHHI